MKTKTEWRKEIPFLVNLKWTPETIEEWLSKIQLDALQQGRIEGAKLVEQELSEILQLAEWGVGNETIGGNIVKLEFWKGQLSAARQMKSFLSSLDELKEIK